MSDREVKSRKEIHFNLSNTAGVSSPLIPFNCLFDTDVGVVRLIKEEYANPDYFDLNFFSKNSTNKDIVNAVYNRKEINPVMLCIKDKNNRQLADETFNFLMTKKYPEVVALSVYTGIFDLCKLFESASDIYTTIVYSNTIELNMLNLAGFDKIKKVSIDNIHAVKYNQCYFKSQFDPTYIHKVALDIGDVPKHIYFLDYEYNFDDKIKGLAYSDDLAILDAKLCEISIINAFNKNKLGLIEGK